MSTDNIFTAIGRPFERHKQAMELEFGRWLTLGNQQKIGAQILLSNGTAFPGQVIPDQYSHLIGAESECFLNALQACEKAYELQYWTGFYSTGFSFFTSHSWCVLDRKVVEVTLPTKQEELERWLTEIGLPFMPQSYWCYFGVRLEPAYVRRVFEINGASDSFFPRTPQELEKGLSPGDIKLPLIEKLPYISSRLEPYGKI